MLKKSIATFTFFYLFIVSIFAEIPAGYYIDANNLHGKALLDALNQVCSDGYFLHYGSGEGFTWHGFYFTDRGEDGTVLDMYSDNVRHQSSYDAVSGMHIEHSFPKSWWGGLENYAYRDLHHLFPADDIANITKNNLPLGVVGDEIFNNGVSKIGDNTFPGSEGKCFEPADEYKGDFARAYLYVATVYNEMSDIWQSPMLDTGNDMVWRKWALDLLLKWHKEDPVSQKELDRQEAVYSIQYNRNPFIDYPELADHIWGDKSETDYTFPAETRPYLTHPNKRTKVLIPATTIGTTEIAQLTFKGNNLTAPLLLNLKNNSAGIKLSKTSFTADEVKKSAVLTIEITSNIVNDIVDTLVVTSAGITELNIPIEANFIDQFMMIATEEITPVSATIKWMKHTEAESYKIITRRGQQQNAPNLFFSGYVEGSSFNKAIAIYNGTGKSVDLSNYTIKKQSNGTGGFYCDYKLSGTLSSGDIYVISHSSANEDIKKYSDISTQNNDRDIMSFNGNDALALYHNNILIDIVGMTDNSTNWGADVTLVRKPEINSPNIHFDIDEWEQLAINDISPLIGHTVDKFDNDNNPIISTSDENMFTVYNLVPDRYYTVHVAAVTKSGSEILTINAIPFRTTMLNTPEAYEATDIFRDRFRANWESVSHAEGYILTLYTPTGIEEITTTEGFDNVTSTGGSLPEGWTGNVSGNYTSTASSGQSIPSVAFKNNDEWLQTPTQDSGISRISFMYRFVSAGEGSYITVYSIDKSRVENKIDDIRYADGSKHITTYEKTSIGNNAVAIKVIYHKAKGNLALDDFSITTGGIEFEELKSVYATGSSYIFDNLESETEYSYDIAAVCRYETDDETTSLPSNVITTKTNDIVFVDNIQLNDNEIEIIINNSTVEILNIENQSIVEIYDIPGRKIKSSTINGNAGYITLPHRSIYIMRIFQPTKATTAYKLMIQ